MLGVALLSAVCSGPNTPTPLPQSAGPSPTPLGPYDVTLEVYEDAPEGPRPIPSAFVVVDFHRPGESFTTGVGFLTDVNGRSVFPNVAHGTTVKIRSDKNGFHQPCSVGETVVSASTLRLELVRNGSRPRVPTSPVLSGMVYMTSPKGREPAVDLGIGYMANCTGLVEMYGRTDDQGRYLFCRVPPGPGCIYMFWGSEGEFEKRVPVNISGDLAVDIDVDK